MKASEILQLFYSFSSYTYLDNISVISESKSTWNDDQWDTLPIGETCWDLHDTLHIIN